MRILRTNDLAIGYSNGRFQTIVGQNIDVTLLPGEFVCLIGPNGVGKSTLMRTLSGMQRPLSGHIWLNETPLEELSARQLARLLSVVLTERVDVGMLSAYAMVALGRHPHTGWGGKLTAQDEQVVRNAITAVGGEPLANRYVNELSDGERQKMMIARALAQEPTLMILDEPTAYLDLPHRVEIMQILRQLAHQRQQAVLLSTHDLDLALRMADKIWLMGKERPLQIGTPEDLVLNGAFSEVFDNEAIAFDLASGTFQICQPQQPRVNVSGNGLGAIWLKRALTREGFEVVEGNGRLPLKVTVHSDTHWQLEIDGQSTHHNKIASLVSHLKSMSYS